MRDVSDLIQTLKRPGSRLRPTTITINGVEGTMTSEQVEERRVVEVNDHAIYFDNGKMMPIGCAGQYLFDGAPDRFRVKIGPAVLGYEIAQGRA